MNSEHEALLLSRIVDRSADEADFEQVGRIASEDPGVWERLGWTLRDDAALRGAVTQAVATTGSVTLPPLPPRSGPWVRGDPWKRGHRRARGLFTLAGAVILAGLAFAAGHHMGGRTAGTPDQLLAEYMRVGAHQGRVLEQLPMLPIATKAAADGRALEIVFVRRLLERAVVDKAFRLGTDEHGRVTPAETSLADYRTPSSF